MLGFLSFPGQHDPSEDLCPVSPDELSRDITEIAIDLINGDGNDAYRNEARRSFKLFPEMIDDVAPEYQELLRKVLED